MLVLDRYLTKKLGHMVRLAAVSLLPSVHQEPNDEGKEILM